MVASDKSDPVPLTYIASNWLASKQKALYNNDKSNPVSFLTGTNHGIRTI